MKLTQLPADLRSLGYRTKYTRRARGYRYFTITPIAFEAMQLLANKDMHFVELVNALKLRYTNVNGRLVHLFDRLQMYGMVEKIVVSKKLRTYRLTDRGHVQLRLVSNFFDNGVNKSDV